MGKFGGRSGGRGFLAGNILILLLVFTLISIGTTTAATTPSLAVQNAQSKQPEAPFVPTIPEKLTPQAVDQFLANISDHQARQVLAASLHEEAEKEAKAAASKAPGGFGVFLVRFRFSMVQTSAKIKDQLVAIVDKLPQFPSDLGKAFNKILGGNSERGAWQGLVILGVLALVGFAAYFTARKALSKHRHVIEQQEHVSVAARAAGAGYRFAFDMAALLAFGLASGLVAAIFLLDDKILRNLGFSFIVTTLLVLATQQGIRLFLAPQARALRIFSLSDESAQFLARWILRFVAVAGYGWALAGLLILSGMPRPSHLLLVMITGGLSAALAIWFILAARKLVGQGLLRALTQEGMPAPGALAQSIAASWHFFAILYVLIIWATWYGGMLIEGRHAILPAFGSVAIVAIIPLCDRVLRGILGNFFDLQSLEKRDQNLRYVAVLMRIFRIFVVVLAAVMLLELWGLRIFGDMAASSVIWDASVDIAVALILAYIGWELVKVGIDRNLVPREVDGELVEPSDRARTLLPLIRKFILITLMIMTCMIILSSLGVDIGPLLAGAGVVGLAIGFGAQALVRDIVSGVFFLIDDAFRLGEYIEMGELRGEVEGISLRSLRLRHHRGPVHTIPMGELRSITNHNRDWVIYKMSFRVPFETDIDKVKKLMKKVGKDMMADEELGPLMIEPLKSQGVFEIDDSGLVIRTKFMCKPREQFVLRREAFKRIKKAFEENGIEFARRKVEVSHAGQGGSVQEGAQTTAAGGAGTVATTAQGESGGGA